jgi:hypothetical protein
MGKKNQSLDMEKQMEKKRKKLESIGGSLL